ncbi:AsmA-like C-terminal region-containing protein [Cerasicoccus fimbriatus]|uniref:AsmA-like C-terminal region-containing protein n=1 Tax=Cerasicoccus fimbriatus TaxID=3014554 RepID=UPI0022B572B6|nr:AsmA-like C-terminal region-containing protein [Cerasicoccus sp. TK19100]
MRWLNLLGRGIHYVINTFLALLFCLLACTAVALLKYNELPVPPQLVELLNKEADKVGLKIKYDRLELDVRGMLFAHGLKVFAKGNSEAVIECDSLMVEISLLSALLGDITPTEVSLENGTFYSPAVISPTGQREELIKKLYVNLTRKAQNWSINTFILEALGARAQLSGNFFTPLPGLDSDPKSDEPPNITGLYVETCREMFDLQDVFKRFENCILTVELENERNGPLLISAQAYIDGYFDQATKVEYGAANILAKASLGEDGILRADGPGRLILDGLKWRDDVKTGFTEAHIRLNNGVKGFSELPIYAELYSYNIEAWGMPFDGAFAVLDMNDFEQTGRVKGDVMVKAERNWMAFKGHFNPKDESGHIKMRARWNPKFILLCSALPKDDIPDNVDVKGRPYWQAEVKLEPGLKPTHSQFEVTMDDVVYEDIILEAAHIEGSITKEALNLYQVDLYAAEYQVTGNYYQRFADSYYHFQSEGTVWPHLLNELIDEDWWTELWQEIKFNGPPPHAAIEMSGKFGIDGAENRIYGSASLENATYMGQTVDQAFTRIWQTPKTLDLFDFAIKTPNGDASVNIHWTYLPNDEEKFLSFLAHTHVPLVEGATIATEDAVPIAKMFPTKVTPSLALAGLVYGDHSEHPGDFYLKTHALFPGRFEFEDIYFDSGNFMVEVTPQEIIVTDGDFSLAGGKALLETTVERQPKDEYYVKSAKIDIQDATLYKLYQAIPFLRVAKAKQDAVERIQQAKQKDKKDKQKPFEERYAGNVNLTFNTHGQLPELSSFIGKGRLELTDANLGQLHLLGGLSSFLYSIGLHLGTLNFNAASADFTLARSNLYIPNGRITGATGEIAANGNFDVDNENLNVMLTVHPLGNVQLPIVSQMLYVLSPLANTFEVELSGTLTAPKYNVKVQPLGIFTGQEKVQDKNADLIQPASEKDSQ